MTRGVFCAPRPQSKHARSSGLTEPVTKQHKATRFRSQSEFVEYVTSQTNFTVLARTQRRQKGLFSPQPSRQTWKGGI